MLRPGSTIGILGGGQLGRMLALAAARLGLLVHIFAPDEECPAADVAARWTKAPYDDVSELDRFAGSIDAVTVEFENVPVGAVEHLARSVPARPSAKALRIAQDRLIEKDFLNDAGCLTAAYRSVGSLEELTAALAQIKAPAILKTRRFGYDGKGQITIRSDSAAAAAWDQLGRQPAILEDFVDFAAEASVIIARNAEGTIAAYDPVSNLHKNHILDRSTVPSGLSVSIEAKAIALARSIVEALDYVGVMGVELFIDRKGEVLVNEIAPRVHNSGHWTIDACAVSQFEQHIRAVAGWPLGSADRHHDAVMINLIGSDVDEWARLAADPAACLHLYGKSRVAPGRKMGHVTRLQPRRPA